MENAVFNEVYDLCMRAKANSATLARARTEVKNQALCTFAQLLRDNTAAILAANEKDLANAKENGVKDTMLDRLRLTEARIEGMAKGAEDIARLDDPVGKGDCWTRPNGLSIRRVRVPMGVVGVIFEARPNVAADVAALCIKSGNAVVLRGGKEAIQSNRAIVALVRRALAESGLAAEAVQLIENTTRASSEALMQMRGLIDVLVPRGGKGLIRAVVDNARVPVIETGAGNCHLYIHADADLSMALDIAVNAKISRPSVCNACETILVNEAVAEKFLPMLKEAMDAHHCEIRGCERTREILPDVTPATEEDWDTEYNDLILAVRVVDTLDKARIHINRYGTGHSETIVTNDLSAAEYFQSAVDAAAVYVNASTRFTDGGEFGFGAELGISTQKLHARGPMGLTALTTEKYLINGNGQVR
ncbi:MAG: glutamate-5-semialdehyde dehydrogenase [Clostridia bacterium]|nr:glutamate-5-semialdehyde dehydrogenase [Clostridia bacterium]